MLLHFNQLSFSMRETKIHVTNSANFSSQLVFESPKGKAEKKVPSIKFLKKHEPPSPAGLQVAPTATIHVINGQVPSTQ